MNITVDKKKKYIKIIALIILLLTILAALIFVIMLLTVYRGISFSGDEMLFDNAKSFNSTVFYANESSDGGEYIPTVIETGGNMRKIFYSLDEISPYLKSGFVAVEDKKFYGHNGIDLMRTLYATVNYLFGGSHRFGASTITQQVIKNISGDNKLSVKRKLQEIIRALHIERNYSKYEILEVYLNVIPMSENVYGVGAASRVYFGKEPNDLLPEEAATLIGITNAPTAYNPYINPEACRKKRDIVLSVMHNEGIISDLEFNRAINTELSVVPRENHEDRIDSWFVETVIDDIVSDMVKREGISASAARMTLLSGGYCVYTTMNPEVQESLEEYFENPDNFPYQISEGLNYSMAVTDSETGYLVGIIGQVGKKKANRLLNHATAPHIPASMLKPIALYAPLIDDGLINWATVFDDVPVSFYEREGEYREYPKNSPDIYDGLTTVKDAIRKSKNTIAVRLCKIRTPKKIYDSLCNDFGFTTLVESKSGATDIATAPMALGQLSRGVPIVKMTESFSAFTGEGKWREALSYLYLVDYRGNIVMEKEQGKRDIYKKSTAQIMNQLLLTVTEDGTASKITLKNQVNTAGKTGTSSGSRDKSFVGYTPYYTAGIWCGYDSERAVSGLSRSHLEIWDDVMGLLHSDIIYDGNVKEFSTDTLVYLPYCMDSGKVYTDTCMYDPRGCRIDFGYFTEDNMPTGKCDRHILCKYDSVSKGIACDDCPEENIVNVALVSVPDRSFPKEIYVTDAEFVYRDIGGYVPRPSDPALPYYEYAVQYGTYVGKSKKEKQFNSNCQKHSK